jgi:hypothetical protein
MPYRNEVQPLNLFGDFLAGKEAAIGQQAAQQGNALRGLQVQRAQGLNALAQNPNATPEQYIRAGDAQTGDALAGAQRQQTMDKQQAFGQLASLAAKALTITDPNQRKGFLAQAQQIYGPAFAASGADMSTYSQMLALPDDVLTQRLESVAKFAQPQKPIEVAKGGSLVLPDGKGGYAAAYTSPSGEAADNGFTLGEGQTRFDAAGKPIASGPAKSNKPESFDIASKLRSEYNAQTKEFSGVADSYQRIKDSASDPSPAGDLSLIFNFMKVLDPGSTVREGEFATAQNAGSVPSRIYAQYNKIMSGERLAPEQRADFVGRATKLYKGQEERFNNRVKSRYVDLAKRNGIDPQDVISDPTSPIATTAPTAPAQAASGPVKVTSPQQAMALPPGTQFVTPDGRVKVRP